jgi:mRNA interferase MazF
MIKGDIVLVPFPFTDLSGNKTRPALILINSALDVTVAFISSQPYNPEITDILLQPDSVSGLKRISVIRLNKIATIDKNLVLGKLGELRQHEVQLLNNNLRHLFAV